MHDRHSVARFHTMDRLRAAMMFLGVLFHCALPYATHTLSLYTPFQDPDASNGIGALTFLLHLFRMPLFFIVAGFFGAMLYQRYGPEGLLRNRSRRILRPLLVFWPVLFITTLMAAAFTKLGGINGILTVAEKLKQGIPLEGEQVTPASLLTDLGLLHLWFLYFLMLFYVTMAVAATFWHKLSGNFQSLCNKAVRFICFSKSGAFLLIGCTALLLYAMPAASDVHAGFDQSIGFVPKPLVLIAFFLFFSYGWVLFRNLPAMSLLKVYAWHTLLPGLLLAGLYAYSILFTGVFSNTLNQSILGAGSIWLLVWGIFGIFLRYLNSDSPVGRYLADASYWVYLIHVPFTLIVPGLLAGLPLPAVVKLLIVFTLITGFCLLSYHYWVRNRFLGSVMGDKFPRRSLQGLSFKSNPHSEQTMLHYLWLRAKNVPGSVGYSFPESEKDDNWLELYKKVTQAAFQLYESGVRKGDYILIMMEGCPETVVSLYAGVSIGAIVTPVNPHGTASELKKILQTIRPKVLIACPTAHAALAELQQEHCSQAGLNAEQFVWIPEMLFLQELTAAKAAIFPAARSFSSLFAVTADVTQDFSAYCNSMDGDLPAFLLFTSGTTGVSKGVAISLNSLRGDGRNKNTKQGMLQRSAKRMFDRFAGRFVAVTMLPLYHYAGLSLLFTPLQICNVRLVHLRRFHPNAALQCLKRTKASILLGTPFMIQSLQNAEAKGADTLAQIKFLIFTSAAVDRHIIQRVIHAYQGLRFFMVTYGTSETGGIANSLCILNRKKSHVIALLLAILKRGNYINNYMSLQDFLTTPFSIGGKVARDVSVGVRCLQTGAWLPAGAHGAILIKSRRTMKYIQQGMNDACFTGDGWFVSGDAGCVNDENIIFISGRISRLISRGGEKISPVEIEEVITAFPGIVAAHVLPMPHELYGEEVGAALQLSPVIPVSLPALRLFLREKLSRSKVPEYFLIMEAFPVSESGKIAEEEIRLAFSRQIQRELSHA